jgi:aspartyl-tRNA(Asn)/glutamyl-tRNA(Gln) amidotransferase subunit A
VNLTSSDLTQLTVEQAAAGLSGRVISPIDLIEATLDRIESVEPRINAFVTVFKEGARAEAKAAEAEIASGRYRGPLHGIPMAVKDLFDIAGSATTASSKVRSDYFPSIDAHVITRLKQAGAVAMGKAHTHEFAYGGITPQVHNPWDPTRIAGGSSGGSAAAVAAGEALFGLGTDTAGSIRIPSSCCGIVGIKPTYGRVSRHGVTPLSPSLDHVGPLAKTVRDAALALRVMAGHDAGDSTSIDRSTPDYLEGIEDGVQGLRVGIPENYFFDNCSAEVTSGVQELARHLEQGGARLVPFYVNDADIFSSVEFCIAMAEASSFHSDMLKERGHLYLDDTRARLEAGQTILATDYLHAVSLRERIAESWRDAFAQFDVALTPTLPTVAPRPAEEVVVWSTGFSESLDDSLTRLNCPHNLTGQPALTMRCGFDRGLPYGAQFIGRSFDELTVFRAARTAEKLVGSWSEGPFPPTSSSDVLSSPR